MQLTSLLLLVLACSTVATTLHRRQCLSSQAMQDISTAAAPADLHLPVLVLPLARAQLESA
jgi:hypothetical protein